MTALAALSVASCAPRAYDSFNTLGVLPPQPPTPIWIGAVRGSSAAALTGAAAVTPSQTPGWAHVLISVANVSTSGSMYAWSLRSGDCSSQGSVIGPADRYADFVIRADGSGGAEAVVPLSLKSAGGPYTIVATPVMAGSGPGACADLARSTM